MVKVSFNSSLGQKESNKEEENSEVLIPESGELQRRICAGRLSRTWCMCLGLAIVLSAVFIGGTCLYRYLMLHEEPVYFCGVRYLEEDFLVQEDGEMEPSSGLRVIQETIRVLPDEDVELINVPVPEFSDGDPANIVHDFPRRLTAYLDLRLNKCYVISLNTSIVMPPKDLRELLENIKDGRFLPQSYLIREQMMVTEQVDDVVQLGNFIHDLCHGKETYRLQRRDTILGMQKREALFCHKIIHFENTFVVDTKICEGVLQSCACGLKHAILLMLLNMLFFLGCC